MNPTKTNPDALGYLLGGVALLAIAVVPLLLAVVPMPLVARLIPWAYWLLGAGAIWWAVRRFTGLGERVAALLGVVVGWYIVLQVGWLLYSINSMP